MIDTKKQNPLQHIVKKPKRLETRLIIWVTGLCVLQAVLFGGLVYQITAQSLHNHIGDKALAVATSIASSDEVVKALKNPSDLVAINQEIENLRQLTDADFIVIGDKNAHRIAHPDRNKLGKKMVGGDSQAALRGERTSQWHRVV